MQQPKSLPLQLTNALGLMAREGLSRRWVAAKRVVRQELHAGLIIGARARGLRPLEALPNALPAKAGAAARPGLVLGSCTTLHNSHKRRTDGLSMHLPSYPVEALRPAFDPAPEPGTIIQLARCECGSSSTEYLLVLCLVTLGAALCVAHWGPGLLQLYWMQRAFLSLPFP